MFGYDFFQQAEYLNTLALKFSHRTVIWLLDEESLGPLKNAASGFISKSRHGGFYLSYYGAYGPWRIPFKSAFYCILRYFLSGPANGANLVLPERPITPALIINRMEDLKRQAARGKTNIVFVLLPAPSKTENPQLSLMRRILAREAMAFLDLDALVKANVTKEELSAIFQGDNPARLSIAGQELLAEATIALVAELSRR